MRSDVLVTPEELFLFARIPEEEQTAELIKSAEAAIEKWSVLCFGPNWGEDISCERVAAAGYEVMGHVEIELFEHDEQRAEILHDIIKHAEWWSRTTYQTVRHFLRHKLKPMAVLEKGVELIKEIRAAKGEFEHYDQIKDPLFKLRRGGVNIAVLKGEDGELERISRDLEAHNIPCRSWKPIRPAVRYYLIDNAYLVLFSHGGGRFTIVGGERGKGSDCVCELWNYDWLRANVANSISGGEI